MPTPHCLRALLTPLLFISTANAFAATADIANVPLGAQTTTFKPNIMFILDNSGSMAWAYMPDEMSSTSRYGYWSSQCNGVAYNPGTTYTPPIAADGTVYPDASVTAAWVDGFAQSQGTVDVSGSGYYTYSGSQTKLNWTYQSTGNVDTTTTFYKECMSSIGSTTSAGYAVFQLVNVSSLTAAEKTNYANWYSYYRTRRLMMRTAAGRAFYTLDSNFRVGFTLISDTGITSSNFLGVADFDSTRKASFFSKLYGATGSGSTPLRGALAKVGKYFGNRFSGQTDPMQYSCQRNFALLSTDGYWNTGAETTSYGPYQLDGSEVGQQDGDESRPMKDGASSLSRAVTITTTTVRRQTVTPETSTTTRQLVSAASGHTGCSSTKYNTTVTTQSCSVSWTKTTVIDYTTTSTSTAYSRDGTVYDTQSSTGTTQSAVSDTSRPSCTTWTTTNTTSNCLNSSSLSNSYGISPGNSTTITGNPTDVAGTTTSTDLSTNTVGPNTTTTTTVSTGDSNSLADVAEYYWKTDLRTDRENNVTPTNIDSATYQHMNTYTVGLGVRGTLAYDRNYLTQTSGDYVDVKAGTKVWPVPSGTLGGSEDATHVDDLWHAAVNGRGQYFSATDPASLSDAISTMLSKVKEQSGAGAAAAASTLTPVTGDDWIFLPSYTTLSWIGDLRAFKFTFSNGKAVPPSDTSSGKEIWSAKAKLDARTDERTLYFNSGGTLTSFTYANLTSAGLNGNFDNRCVTAGASLSQCASLTTAALPKVTGANLVDYLRGSTALYMSAASADDQVFRTRSSRLGDFGNASPAYVSKPPFKYTDSGYASFVTANSGRTPVVYAAANDGMLHAFNVGTGADGGAELWAFVPTPMMANLWRLASADYTNNHRYFVDGTPVVGDVYDSTLSRWRTILVGGFGAGGRGYYALDVTTPDAPTLLWEISNATSGFANLGLSYGNPIITKNSAGNWVVAFSSGVNNVSSGDGIGRLYIVNAITGAKITEVSTGAGSTGTPSNLSRMEGWIEEDTNNTVLRFYAGDMLGNFWRFDWDNLIAPSGNEALLLGTAQTSAGAAQPITTRPVLTSFTSGGGTYNLVSFGTGRYLGTTDLADTTVQTFYTVKDTLTANNLCYGRSTTLPCVLRSSAANLVQQTMAADHTASSTNTVNFASSNGWYIDFDRSTGERVYIDPTALNGTTLSVATTLPSSNVCTPGGTSYLYTFTLGSGVVASATAYSKLIVGNATIVNLDGTKSSFLTFGDQTLGGGPPADPSTTSSTIRRSTWRELID